ncbi:LysE family transporter [uncultured Dokdonia sp.]|uniref:LysE family translocator n=1 Tax=uncultured Dokdonia sp. TaxID=575653 RepID=UPI0026324B54|nr:LysE family transporter [uncultured Dokdonia sp.]
MFQDFPAALTSGLVLAFMIGPVFFVLLETAATRGFRAAIIFNLGVFTADIVFIGIAYLSSYQLLENLSNAPGLYVFGGVILIVYGLMMYLKRPTREMLDPTRVKGGKHGYFQLFIKGFLLNFINIGVLVIWLGVIIVVGPTVDNDPVRLFTFLGIMLSTYFVVDLGKIVLAKQLKGYLTPRRIFKVKKLLGLILIICGLVLTVKGFLPKDKMDIKKGLENFRDSRE